MFKKGIWFLSICLLILISTNFAFAGFGISPPYVSNDSLARGSVYEKKITIVRGDPLEDLKAEITINVPGANDWITIDKGKEFILPKGEKQVPIIVKVQVPKQAAYGIYKGSIRIKTSSLAPLQKGTITIALGAQIDVDLNVSQQKIFDFLVRGVTPFDAEEGYKKWIFFFPTKLVFQLRIENLGNINCRPTKIVLDIYDSNKTNLLETVEASKIGSVKPFENNIILANFLTKLQPGSYYAHYKVYKNNEVAQGGEGEVHLSIMPKGTIAGYKEANIFDLGLKDKIIIAFGILLIAGLMVYTILKIVRIFRKK